MLLTYDYWQSAYSDKPFNLSPLVRIISPPAKELQLFLLLVISSDIFQYLYQQ